MDYFKNLFSNKLIDLIGNKWNAIVTALSQLPDKQFRLY